MVEDLQKLFKYSILKFAKSLYSQTKINNTKGQHFIIQPKLSLNNAVENMRLCNNNAWVVLHFVQLSCRCPLWLMCYCPWWLGTNQLVRSDFTRFSTSSQQRFSWHLRFIDRTLLEVIINYLCPVPHISIVWTEMLGGNTSFWHLHWKESRFWMGFMYDLWKSTRQTAGGLLICRLSQFNIEETPFSIKDEKVQLGQTHFIGTVHV